MVKRWKRKWEKIIKKKDCRTTKLIWECTNILNIFCPSKDLHYIYLLFCTLSPNVHYWPLCKLLPWTSYYTKRISGLTQYKFLKVFFFFLNIWKLWFLVYQTGTSKLLENLDSYISVSHTHISKISMSPYPAHWDLGTQARICAVTVAPFTQAN